MSQNFRVQKQVSKSLHTPREGVGLEDSDLSVNSSPTLPIEGERISRTMKERDFSLRARRTTRIALRVPVRISTRDSNQTLNAWTVVINKHGARFECKHSFEMFQQVVISIFNGKTARGKVIWVNPKPDRDGNFEFAVGLDEPTNLFNVGFPPQDWEEPETAEHTGTPLALEAPISSGDLSSASSAQLILEEGVVKETPAGPLEQLAPSEQVMDLTPMLSSLTSVPGDGHSRHSVPQTAVESLSGDSPSCPLSASSQPQAPREASEPLISIPVLSEPEIAVRDPAPDQSQYNAPPGLTGVPASQRRRPEASQKGDSAMTVRLTEVMKDRLSEVMKEMIESAIQVEEDASSERLVKEVKDQIAEAQRAALANLEEQVHSLISSQKALLEARATELVGHSQRILEEGVRRFTEAGEKGSSLISSQIGLLEGCAKELAGQSQQTLEESLRVIREAGEQRSRGIQQESESMFAALENSRNAIAQLVPGLEDQFLQQCRSRTEQLLSATLDASRHALSNQIDEFAEKMQERAQKIFVDSAHQLEQCSVNTLAETRGRLEAQMAESAMAIHSNFAQNVVKELSEKQTEMMEPFQQQIGMVREQNLAELRSGLVHMLKEVADGLTSKT